MAILPDLNYVRSIPDPAPNWRWVVKMPTLAGSRATNIGLGGGLGFSVGVNIGPVSLGLSADLPTEQLFSRPVVPFGIVDQIDFSTQTIDSDDRFQAGARTKYPRFLSMANVSITFFEDVTYATTQYLSYWKSLVVDEEHNYGLPTDYKKEIYLFAFDTISNYDPTFVGRLKGCWPTSISGLSYSNGASDKVSLVCDFAVDEATPFAAGESYGSTGASSLFGAFLNFSARLNVGPLALSGNIRL